MDVKLFVKFSDEEELREFLYYHADIIDFSKIEGYNLMKLDTSFYDQYVSLIDLHALFISAIGAGDKERMSYCLNNGVGYNDKETKRRVEISYNDVKTPIEVAFKCFNEETVEFFLEEDFLSKEDIQKTLLFLVSSLAQPGHHQVRIDFYLKWIKKIVNEQDIDLNIYHGLYLENAICGNYKEAREAFKFFVDKGANIRDLDILYVKGKNYNIETLKLYNTLVEKHEQVDINFFLSGKFKDQ